MTLNLPPAFLAIAAWLLGLSLFVQILQELYKTLTSSKSTAYTQALTDFAGPFALQILSGTTAADFAMRGPFQLKKWRPMGRLMPLEKPSLVEALERTTPVWHQLASDALSQEVQLQNGGPAPISQSLVEFLASLDSGRRQQPGGADAGAVLLFLGQRRVSEGVTVNAAALLTEFRNTFYPHIVKVEDHFDQLMRNFAEAYRRRNLRQTFVLALFTACWLNLPFDSIYEQAANVSRADAIAAALASTTAADRAAARNSAAPGTNQTETTPSTGAQSANATPDAKELLQQSQDALLLLPPSSISYVSQPWERVARVGDDLLTRCHILTDQHTRLDCQARRSQRLRDIPRSALGYILTAILVCFGAPFWNNLTKSMLRASQGNGPLTDEPKDTNNG